MLLWRGLWTCQGSCVYIVLDDCADCVVEYSLSVQLWMVVLLVVVVVVVLLVVLRLLEVNCNRYCWH